MSEGTKAFLSGLKPSEGPYSKFSYQGRLWLKGYSNARFGAMNLNTDNIDFWKNDGGA